MVVWHFGLYWLYIVFFPLQVEAALTSDPSNAELLKLKGDLLEVITLTENLIDTQGLYILNSVFSCMQN